MKKWLVAACLYCSVPAFAQKFENLALTPPMGWNSWNTFNTHIDEKMVLETADVMVSSGMRDAGYKYLVLDDAWMAMERDSAGYLAPDPQKFPHGMKAIADYVHSKGLLFGLYNCAGTKTCAGFPGTRGYEYQDARRYAEWEIDYLKFDWCNTEGINAKEAYGTMSKALRKTGRPIVFSLCEWGSNKPWEWAAPIGQLWRTTGDISPVFDGVERHGNWDAQGAMRILDQQVGLAKYAGPGHWNDPDMLEVGTKLTESEDRAHFTMWCMLAAPLIAGNDVRDMKPATLAILTNKAAIAIDQDSLGVEGFRYSKKDSLETWLKPLSNGDWALCFLNRADHAQPVTFDWRRQAVTDSVSGRVLDGSMLYKWQNVWTPQLAGSTARPFQAAVPAHDVVLLRLSKAPEKKKK
ncbi:MAG TPA: glycoside hydrolase family 27 protein [Chitinophaga sp.]